MKRNFKTLLAALLLFPFLPLTAQDEVTEYTEDIFVNDKKVHFQIRGGMNISNLYARYKNEYDYADAKIGYNVGAYVDIELKNYFYMFTGLAFTTKGAKIEDVEVYGEGTFDATMNAMYLQLPVYFGYRRELNNNKLKLGFAAGPYFAYGIGGKSKFESLRQGGYPESDTFDKNGLWNRFELGLGFEVNLEADKFIFAISTEAGITNAWKKDRLEYNANVTNSVVGLSIGYKF